MVRAVLILLGVTLRITLSRAKTNPEALTWHFALTTLLCGIR
jgi:hypothetical protein